MYTLCSFAVGILLILVLAIAGVSAYRVYSLYANITSSNKLDTVEEGTGQGGIVQFLNVTSDHTLETALEEFIIERVKNNLSHIDMDISTLDRNTSSDLAQLSADIEALDSIHSIQLHAAHVCMWQGL